MRVIVFSDSHGDVRPMDKALAAVGGAEAVIHLGDVERDVRYLEKTCGLPVYAVLGNNDFGAPRLTESVVELGGARIFICHGHTRGVGRGTESLVLAAESRGCQAALYGHTHRPDDRRERGLLVFNPGSCSRPRMGAATFGVLEIENGGLATAPYHKM